LKTFGAKRAHHSSPRVEPKKKKGKRPQVSGHALETSNQKAPRRARRKAYVEGKLNGESLPLVEAFIKVQRDHAGKRGEHSLRGKDEQADGKNFGSLGPRRPVFCKGKGIGENGRGNIARG